MIKYCYSNSHLYICLLYTSARGLIPKINSLETAFMAELWGFILQRLNDTNKKLQSTDIDLSSMEQLCDSLIKSSSQHVITMINLKKGSGTIKNYGIKRG